MLMHSTRPIFGCLRLAVVPRWCAVGIAAVALFMAAAPQSARAGTLCVNPQGTMGCFSSINAALAAAAPGDAIRVASGTYKEYVIITRSVALIGQNRASTTIDAGNLPFGINVDGYDNPGLTSVVISGFTITNAQNAGIVVSNASNVTIEDNRVTNNDQGLSPSTGTCPTLDSFPYFFGEVLDCGEGILFSGVDHSTIAANLVTGNAGGLLITDDTAATHDNAITGNAVIHNTALDCGITMPSHSGAGVFHNTVADNDSSYNGGPGVGIFAPGPGSKAYANVVIHNRLRGNGLPGVTMHNHAAPGVHGVPAGAPPVMFNDNVIVGNDISENSQDFEDAATAGPTGINVYSVAPMTGTVISQNWIHDEQLDIVVNVPPSGMLPVAEIHLNNLLGKMVGVQDLTTANVDATQNWWGCSNGPGAAGCAGVSGSDVTVAPWLAHPFAAPNHP